MITKEQIAERKNGLFATDAAPALGMSKYRTPVAVWLEKTGQAEPEDLSNIEAVQMGNFMEPHIAALYRERLGVRLDPLPVTLYHPKHSFMGSHFDYVAPGKKLVEIKNFSAMRRKEFGENGSKEVPMDVLIQCIHEATVFQTEEIDVAVLFGGQEFCVFPLQIDPAASVKLVEMEEEFWRKCVIERAAPEPRTTEETRRLFPHDDGETILVTADVYADVNDLRRVRKSIAELEEIEESLKARIQAFMGYHSTLVTHENEVLTTWKRSKASKTFDKAAFEKQHPALYASFVKDVEGSRRFLLKG